METSLRQKFSKQKNLAIRPNHRSGLTVIIMLNSEPTGEGMAWCV
jgi:hypothetical protein